METEARQTNLPQTTTPTMFGQLMNKPRYELSPDEIEALDLHERIVFDRQAVEVGIVNMCRDLKEMRDGKYYVKFGFNEFGEYTETMHGIGERQAYKYIRVYEKLGGEFLNSNSKIGVTKLLELASLDNDERQELLAEHSAEELESMSIAEVKRLTEQVKSLQEQISIFENSDDGIDRDAIRAEIDSELRNEYEARMADASATANQEKLKALSEQRDEVISLKTELKQAQADMKANAEAIKSAEARAKIAEEKAAQAVDFELKFKKLEAEKAEIEKQIKLSSDPELTRFKYMFETWQSVTSAMFEQLEKLDKDVQDKMRNAVKAVMGDQA